MAGLCEGGNEPPGFLKAISTEFRGGVRRRYITFFEWRVYILFSPTVRRMSRNFLANLRPDFAKYHLAVTNYIDA
ncbi:hypothetical protein ANN_14644 [Periplaneta americana]|uniref:Uncharacterized protein n=1 Tax=Periplaneta americana TaxID=6978 RepID=A0ABQ8SYD5_PERAM|nr:hypothetical protein ANN_14644 [Periplaneta americana]